MNLIPTEKVTKVRKNQQGGQIPAQPAQGGQPEQDPMMIILQGAEQALQSKNCEQALQVCGALLEIAQGAQQEQPQGEPVYKKGGKLVKRLS